MMYTFYNIRQGWGAMEEIKDLQALENIKKELLESRPNDWDSIPDIDLYMDQVINYMQRQHIGFECGETLTSAMINNYIKSEIMPRATGKKYNRDHVAYLTVICLLKQVLDLESTGIMLREGIDGMDIRSIYEYYSDVLNQEFTKVSSDIKITGEKDELLKQALQLAISSYAQKLACQSILKTLAAGEEPPAKEKLAKEKASKEKPAKEKASKEKPAKDKPQKAK